MIDTPADSRMNLPHSGVVGSALASVATHVGSAFLFSVLINTLFLASPLYMMQLYGRVLTSGSLETLVSLSIALVLVLVVMAASDAARGRILARASARLSDRLAGPATRAALAEGRGRLAGALSDIDVLRRFAGGGSAATLLDAPFTLLFLFVLFLLHPVLGLVASFGAAIILASVLGARLVETARERRIAERSRAIDQVAAALGSDRGEIRALGVEAGLADALAREQSALGALRQGSGELNASVGAFARFSRLAAHSAALATGAVLAISGELSPASMLAAAILAGRALGPIEALPAALRHARQTRAAFQNLATLTRRAEGARGSLPTGRRAGQAGISVEVRRLVVSLDGGSAAILRSVGFRVAPGEVISIAGSSGAGKSTLLRCLAGADRPRSGEIRLAGTEITAIDPRTLSDVVGWMPQGAQLYPGTLAQNIARFRDAPEAEIRLAAERAGALAQIERLPEGFATRVDGAGATLSPSIRQATAFARALFGSPALVLLDQPTAHMDAQGEVAALNALRRLKQGGITVIIVSHKPVLATLADRIMLLEEGVIEVFEDRKTVLGALRAQSIRSIPTSTTAGGPDTANHTEQDPKRRAQQ